ncbi:MAG TPA: formate dehydrogenase accessory sulfurtransferase FdhD [Acidimicrobiales bacterium]|nr:formate dehydrogenase accessory sulfurtransferase FdhD [Acidimicrobiales bacterium]
MSSNGDASRPASRTPRQVRVIQDGRASTRPDELATEEPLEIRLLVAGRRQSVAITMRTPGADFELAVGFLFSEGIIAGRADVRRVTYCTDRDVDADQRYNIVNVELAGAAAPDLRSLERHFFTNSACGVCGKATLDALEVRCPPLAGGPDVAVDVLYGLPERLRRGQGVFDSTGGLHATGLFTSAGDLLAIREDVGRHNALDKLIGWAVLQDRLPLDEEVLLVSGRSSYEILQKAITAGVSVVCGISAPSSLAVAMAERFGVTLVGFLRERRCNVYTHPDRILAHAPVITD